VRGVSRGCAVLLLHAGEEELDIQGAFATELLDRFNIHNPKKSGSSSRAAYL
jgi:hypothetical protein